jgi:pimeloyl-ACP methyl ester carboxylesterase
VTTPRAIDRHETLHTADGERLAAVHLPHTGGSRAIGVVVAHGFTGAVDKQPVRAIVERLATHAGVLAFDFRGHGRSSGVSTLGDLEILDVDTAVMRLRALGYERVVTCGWSMGGSAVIRHAALHRGVDAVVSVSSASRWYYRGTRPMRLLHLVVERRLGRLVARRLLNTRIHPNGKWAVIPESPEECAPLIAPTPLLVVHGDRDTYFPLEHPEAIYAAAHEPKELWVIEGMGHAEVGATAALVDRIGAHLPALLARAEMAS